MPDDRRVAVIGMALRFPGAGTTEQYWRDIEAGVSHVRRFGRAELRSAGASEDLLDDPDLVGASALLDGIDGFDAAFFGMTGREAEVTDPQQRLLLECCHHALEDGGYAGSDARIGVYGSVGYRLYSLHSYLANNLADLPGDDWIAQKQVQVGNYPDFAANRAAFRLGLRGPAVNVATACSSALVSVHLACQALLAGDAELMLVGSAALHLPQITGHRHVKGSTISRSGTVRAFDADADGTVGGNGVAAVLLKPLARALADGDTVHAVILGSAVTNDGDDKGGFAAPGVAGQRDAVLGALSRAGVPADSLGYLEAHGTGTFKGDPIEFTALTEAFRAHTDGTAFCALGSTKPAIGHLDSAAGLAGLIKAILVLRHGVIPPLVNFTRANPLLALETSPFVVPTRATPWPNAGVRRAGVHSIGMGGTNAHVIVEEAPGRVPEPVRGERAGPVLLPLSARTPGALTAYARAFRDELVRRPDLAPADLLTTTALGRRHLPHRLVVTAPFVEGLDAFLAGAPGALTGTADRTVAPAFLFSGQGTGGPGMAAALAARFPVVAEVLRECARIHEEETGETDFLARLTGEGAPSGGHEVPAPPAPWDTAFAQPAIFALQVAQLRLWRSWGVRPGSVAGHSVGEYAALCAAGALSLADGMRLLCRRGRLMRDTAPGAMLAVFADRDRVRELAAQVGRVELAVSNGPAHQVLAGPPEAIAEAHRRLTEQGLTGVPLPVDRAFHSALLDPVLDDLRAAVGKAELRPVEIEFVSGLDGVAHPPGWLPDADHLVRQARRTADFHAVLRTLAPVDALLELGPDATLTRLARRAVPDTLCVPTGGTPDEVWRAAARLHCAGAPLDWAALLEGCGGRRIPLPTYPFEHRSYWIGPPPPPATAVPAHEPAREPDGEDDVTDQAVLKRVLELTAQHLGYDQDGLRAGETYVGLGADSLQLIGMLRQLEGEFGVRLAVRDLLEDAGSPDLTARLIAERAARPAPEPRAEIIDVRHIPEPRKAAPQALETPQAPEAPGQAEYASRSEVAELRRQIDLLAETQASLITQLSDAVALLTAERAAR
ncbi:type I polyketide synthase [Streptomyces sp. NBC_00140]|uniref:type I polyketide synthase n=1 Tax=Streptomyces sp. NBC_00140 TaxID=2975664 RepID=UPI00225224D6|nr:beta-ketoacyl synthase N-terminal-like domain-containing protein [Streptomyces sp. NBC_00140]MCX5333731.1 acyltransferase domain-containing protein [Streptomyces sp. NBC_00140]